MERCQERSASGHIMWLCSCSCGVSTIVRGTNLRHGKVKSCGCLALKALEKRTTHGQSKHSLYNTWNLMRARCYNRNNASYDNYGARGISVCDDWLDFNRGYSLDNCKWVTCRENSNNRRSNRVVTFEGESKTLAEWSRKVGVSAANLLYRIKAGWSLDKVLLTPVCSKEDI